MAAPMAARASAGRAAVVGLGAEPSWCAAPARYVSRKAGVRRSVKKARARKTWANIRGALKFAERYDMRLTTELSVRKTLKMMGWPVTEHESIAEGLTVRFAVQHRYLAIEVLMAEDYVPGTMVLVPEAQARLDAIHAAGWKCLTINQRAWERRAEVEHRSAFACRDLIVKLAVDNGPFEARGAPPKAIGLDAVRAAKGTIHTKKRMSGNNA